jgi:hypothetical protein
MQAKRSFMRSAARLSVELTMLFAVLACSLTSPTPTSPVTPTPQVAPSLGTTQTAGASGPTALPAGKLLPTVSVETEKPFSANVALRSMPKGAYAGPEFNLPLDLKALANPGVIENLSSAQRAMLEENGFTILQTQDEQFFDIREHVAIHYGQPYYLTTDAAYHALHLTFDEMLKALEQEQLRPQMIDLTRALVKDMAAYSKQLAGMPLEADARLASGYLAVALRLFDPGALLDSELEKMIAPQLAQIKAAAGRDKSALIPAFEDDYSAYKPVGHYSGVPELESYFQGMTWFGRVPFFFKNPSNPDISPSRAPLLITFALRRNAQALETWQHAHEILTFLIGPSDDAGPAELAALMDQVYGANLTLASLANAAVWQTFLARSSDLPAPQINSTFVASLGNLQAERGWRFMGQRFTLDGFIMQNLVFDRVGTQQNKREKPSGLDVMAALGSNAADDALRAAGETGYQNYTQQMKKLKQAVTSTSQEQWFSRFSSGWLYTFVSQLTNKTGAYPQIMRSEAWRYKDLNSALGSWVELKHDTALYTKMPEMAGGGGPPSSGPAPVYVEPVPDVFFRLAYLSSTVVQGLADRGINAGDAGGAGPSGPLNLAQLIAGMQSLSERFNLLGEIAVKELKGETPSDDERWTLQSCLGPVECMVLRSRLYGEEQKAPPIPLVAAVAGAGQTQVLEAAIGNLSRIFVVIPWEGQLQVAQGGVFSYYEFTRSRSQRLTDEDWRLQIAVRPPERPDWIQKISLPGGSVTDVVAFRKGDTYLITRAGANLNLRAAPSTQVNVLKKLQQGDYITFLDGPIKAEKYTWWKVRLEPFSDETGWVVEDPTWYERAYGQ